MINSKNFPTVDPYLHSVATMTNNELPTDRSFQDGCIATALSGRLLVDQTMPEKGYDLIDAYLQADPGILDWAKQVGTDNPTAKRIISLVATREGMMCRGHGLIGGIISDIDSIDILESLGTDAPGTPKAKEEAMSPLGVCIYGIFGTLAYVDLYTQKSNFIRTIASDTRNALMTALRDTDIVVALSKSAVTIPSTEPDIRFLGLTDYTIENNKFIRRGNP